jgi:IS30 family transposase
MAIARRGQARKRIDASTWAQVEKLSREDWSPEQIIERLKEDHDLRNSHEWIYQYILAGKLAGEVICIGNLRCQKARRKRYSSYYRRGKLPERPGI